METHKVVFGCNNMLILCSEYQPDLHLEAPDAAAAENKENNRNSLFLRY